MSKLSVHLVTWNGAKYIPYLFESLRLQTFKDWELLIIDNGSQKDNTVELIKKELENFSIPFRFIENKENLGFAPGHNRAIHEVCRPERAQRVEGPHDIPEYIQLLNQDMYLAPDYFEKVVAMMDAHPEAGAGQGLLLKWNFSKVKCQMSNVKCDLKESLTDIIDTLGLQVLRNRRVVDYKTGQILSTIDYESSSPVEVFGVSGALPAYRRSAIEQVMFEGQMFDQDLFMYKEDVDLAFRMRSAGWKAYTACDAKAWHDRSAAGPKQMSDKAALSNRKTKSAFINYHSYKNHLMVLIKNEHRANLTKDWPWIFWYEFKKFAFLLLTDWKTLKGLSEIKRLWPRLMQKRQQVMNNYKVKSEAMRAWFTQHETRNI